MPRPRAVAAGRAVARRTVDGLVASADYAAALTRYFGAAADEARNDRARNGSRPDHPLHPAFIAKNEAASAWIAEKQNSNAAAA